MSVVTAIVVALILTLASCAVSACSDNRPTYALTRPADFGAPGVRLRPSPAQETSQEQAGTADGSHAVRYEALVGSSVGATPTRATSLSDAECIAWIIDHGSHGDPWAENGRYKGIGQLDETYYPRYIGRTWDEVKGDYDAQFEAMTAYVMARYGSWQAAYEHTVAVGWY
jgi:hypothetical protein